MAKAVVGPVGPGIRAAPQWELAAQWAQGWRILKWSVSALVVITFLMVIGQGYLFYRLFDDVHPVLGYVYILVLTGLIGVLVVRPVMAFLSMPVAARPPEILIDPKAPAPGALAARIRYDVRYLQMMAANPAVQAERAAIDAAIVRARAMMARAAKAAPAEAMAISVELEAFERTEIEALLAPLDKRVNAAIHTEAVAVGVATALSMNGTVDAFIVL